MTWLIESAEPVRMAAESADTTTSRRPAAIATLTRAPILVADPRVDRPRPCPHGRRNRTLPAEPRTAAKLLRRAIEVNEAVASEFASPRGRQRGSRTR